MAELSARSGVAAISIWIALRLLAKRGMVTGARSCRGPPCSRTVRFCARAGTPRV